MKVTPSVFPIACHCTSSAFGSPELDTTFLLTGSSGARQAASSSRGAQVLQMSSAPAAGSAMTATVQHRCRLKCMCMPCKSAWDCRICQRLPISVSCCCKCHLPQLLVEQRQRRSSTDAVKIVEMYELADLIVCTLYR